MKVRWIALAILWVAVGMMTAAQGGYTPEIEWDDCPFMPPAGEVEGETMECGYLIVPQDRRNIDEGMIELAFAILYSENDLLDDPVIYLEGGPGGSALAGMDMWIESPLRQDRDIILLDQRGTGYSFPRLYCYEYEGMDDDLDDEAREAALLECLERLIDEGIDLTDYNSTGNAADVDDLRIALAYDEWNLYGISYGTRLALTIMRDFPEGVRSAVLDSTYPPMVDAYEEQAINTYRVFRLMFDDCAADAACNAAFPNLESRFWARVDSLNDSPAELPDDLGALSGDDLIGMLFDLFYDTAALPYLPLMIDEIDRGVYETLIGLDEGSLPPGGEGDWDEDDLVWLFADEFFYLLDDLDDNTYEALLDELDALEDWDSFAALLYDYFDEDDADYLVELLDEMDDVDLILLEFELFYEDVSDTDGMFNAFECHEEMSFNSYDDAVALMAGLPEALQLYELAGFEMQMMVCQVWESGIAGAVEDAPVVSDIPALILAGNYDPVTPPSWGLLAAETLSAGFFYEFPGVGHGAIDGGDCPMRIIQAFLESPTTAPDGGCIDAMAMTFILP